MKNSVISPSVCTPLLRTGNVIDYSSHGIIVEISAQQSCEQCAQGRGCGLGLMARRQSQRIVVNLPSSLTPPEQHYSQGQAVTISLPRASITLLAFCIYALPLFTALLLSGLASLWSSTLWLPPVIFFASLVVGAISVKYLLSGQSERFRPRLVS